MGVLKVWDPISGTYVDVVGAGIAESATDHGLLTGLSDPDHSIDAVQGLQTALDGKAPLVSPAFTGNPTAPTPTAGDNDTSIATTAFVAGGLTYRNPIIVLDSAAAVPGGTPVGTIVLRRPA